MIGHLLNKTITVKRPSPTTSGGRTTISYGAHLSGVAARLHQLSGSDLAQYGAQRGVNVWRISVDPGNDIIRGDQVLFTDADAVTHTMAVQSVRNSSQGFGSIPAIKVMECEEVTNAG